MASVGFVCPKKEKKGEKEQDVLHPLRSFGIFLYDAPAVDDGRVGVERSERGGGERWGGFAATRAQP